MIEKSPTDCIFVLDTNVILTDPDVLNTYGDKLVAVTDTVLAEVDKVKIGRADADTRFNGREFSRMLFELSEGKSLIEGVKLPQGGELHVLYYDVRQNMPEGLSAKSPDDRIVAQAIYLQEEEMAEGGKGRHVILVTSDLNMLLKAQSYGLAVLRHNDELNSTFTKKYIVKPFQKYKTPLTILMVALAIFLATLFLLLQLAGDKRPETPTLTSLPSEYRNFVAQDQATIIDALLLLQTQPQNTAALTTVGNAYFDLYQKTVKEDPATAVTYANRGTEYFERKLEIKPDDKDSLNKMGILSFYSGSTDKAISTLSKALTLDSDNVEANYYLGIVYMQGRRDYNAAQQLFEKVISLAKDNPELEQYVTSSQSFIQQINNERDKILNTPSDGVVL